MLTKIITKVTYIKRAGKYRFTLTSPDKQTLEFLELIVGNPRTTKVVGKNIIIDMKEANANAFINFAKNIGILK